MSEAAIGGERELSGPEKAAALLLMMGKPPAARLLKQFDQPDLRAVALAAAGLGAIPATMLDRLVEEFVTIFPLAPICSATPDRPRACSPTPCRPSKSPTFSALRPGKPDRPMCGGRWGKRRRARLSPC